MGRSLSMLPAGEKAQQSADLPVRAGEGRSLPCIGSSSWDPPHASTRAGVKPLMPCPEAPSSVQWCVVVRSTVLVEFSLLHIVSLKFTSVAMESIAIHDRSPSRSGHSEIRHHLPMNYGITDL